MLKSFFDRNFPETSPSDLLAFAIVLVSSLVLLIFANRIIVRNIRKKAAGRAGTGNPPSLEIEKKTLPILYCVALFCGLQVLTLGAELAKLATVLFFVGIGFFSVRLAVSVVEILVDRRWAKEDENSARLKTIKAIFSVFKIAIWGIAIFVLLDNLGVNLTAILAGLGIGGIALALAAQTILGDLFSCFVIYIDRPFEVGDYISIDAYSGTIQRIGIKTTRIRSLSGEQLVFSNSDLTMSRLRNYKRMEKRRVSFKLGVAYDTATEGLRLLPAL